MIRLHFAAGDVLHGIIRESYTMNPSYIQYIATPFVEACFTRFERAYADTNYGLAYQAFMEALQAQPRCAYRYFTTQASAQLVATVRITNNISPLCRWLNHILPDHPNMNLMYYGDAELTERFTQIREENIAKGLPSVVLITQGKSASISISNIFNSGFGLPSFAYSFVDYQVIPSWIQDYARGGACYTTHLSPSQQNIISLKESGIDKIIVHVRDPRQAIISTIHHKQSYPDQAPEISQSGFGTHNIETQLQALSGIYTDYIDWLNGWVDAAKELPIHFSVFYKFVENKEKFIQEYLDYYGAPEAYFDYEQATKIQEGTDYHLRKGLTNEWRDVMPEKFQKHFSFLLPDHIKEKFGWVD